MQRPALKNMIKIILLGCCLILAALGAALYFAPGDSAVTASAAVKPPISQFGQCPSCGQSAAWNSRSATCTTAGFYSWNCSHCGYKDSGTTPALGHNYGSYVETSAPTCTSAGVETATCSRCGDTKTRTGDAALGHSPQSADIAATCTSSGTSGRKVCTRCGTVTSSGTTVSALGHSYSWTTTSSATCTSGGTQRGTCSRCGDTTTRSTSALGHNMRTSYYSATCTSGGYTYHYCSRCSYSYTSNYTSALGHNYGAYTTTKSPTCTATGTETATCSRCSATTSRTLSALGHDYGDYIVTIAPGCTTAGEETSTCSRCQATQTRSVDALGHSPVTDAAVPAACTVAGLTEGSHCSRCNTVLEAQETVPALGHDYGSYVTTTPPTCTATGIETATCTRCDAETSRTVAALGHDLTEHAGKAPTCTEIGWEAYETCSRCDYTTYAEIAATGHTPGAAATCTEPQICTVCGAQLSPATGHTPGAAATCLAPQTCLTCGAVLAEATGHTPGPAATCTEDQVCLVCDAVLAEATGHTPGAEATCTEDQVCTVCGAVLVSAKGHTLGPGATCTEDQVCTVCGAVISAAAGHIPGPAATCTTAQTCSVCGTVLVAALGHVPVTDAAVPATCTTPGKTEGSHCSRCGAVLTAQETVPAIGHSYGSYVATTSPTCTATGIETATCTRCGAETTRTIAALGHSPVTDPAVPATCTETGLTAGSHCSRCETGIKAQQEIPALGHSWGAYIETTPATCTEAGEETSTCSRCQATRTRSVDALGHSPVTDPAVPATCTETGLTEGSHCSRCDVILTVQQEIPALGHSWGEYVQTIAPGCTTAGEETSTCSRCQATQTRSVDALGHSPVTDPAVPATCTETGLTEGSHCSRCNTILTVQETVPALGHDWGAYIETTPATCTETGIETSTCSRCQATRTRSIPAKGHILGPDATCTEDQVCTVCGAVISAAAGHIPGPAATCTTAQTCSVCGTVLADALGHDLISHAGKAPTCTEIGWEAYETCSRCDYTTYAEIAATGHTPGAAATCTTAQVCTVCGAELKAALGHDLTEHAGKAPTCTEIGWEAYKTCSRCDYTTYEEIAATGHTPGSAATCTEPQTCTVCGTELQAASGHTPGAAATCTTAQVCTVCGTELQAALGHKPGAAATCTTAQTCTVCGAELEAALGHKAGPAATCTTAQLCTVCGAELEAALGHVPVVDAAKAPTCTETGLEAGAHCSRCEEVLLEQAEIPALGHQLLPIEDDRTDCTQDGTQTRRCSRCDYVETTAVSGGLHSWRPGKILRESTCSEAGAQQIVCVFCGATDEVELHKTSHKVITTDAVPATCDKPGMTGGIMCAVCGQELLGRSEIPALGHSLAFVPGVDATATTDGMLEHYKCNTCNGLFADAEGTQRLTDTDLIIPATGGEPGTDDPDAPGTDDPAPGADAGLEPWQWALIVAACVVVKIGIAAAIVAAVKAKKRSVPAAKAKQRAKRK